MGVGPARILAATLVAAATAVAGASAHPGPVGQAPTRLDLLVWAGKPVFCGGPGKRVFALTFDDGPSPWTEGLVAALRRDHARATFFLVGDRVRLWHSAALAAAAAGAVGNHTWTHPLLTSLPRRRIRLELVSTGHELHTLGADTRLFRPPYDRSNPRVRAVVHSLGLLDVRWNVDSGDSRRGARPGPVAREVVHDLKPGAIVLMHDSHPWTGRVVRAVLAAARRRHLRPVTVPRLLELDPPVPGHSCYA